MIFAFVLGLMAYPGTSTISAQEFLDGGGGIRREPDISFSRGDRGFLEDGGSVRARPDIVIGRQPSGFLRDGGGIYAEPDIAFTPEREEFLEDGGSVSTSPTLLIDRGPGWRVLRGRPARYMKRGSLLALARLSSYRLEEAFLGHNVVTRPRPDPKIIDVATESLDQHPIPASGIEVIYNGGAKIIRIAEHYRRKPHSVPTARPAPRNVRPGEPWSPAWLSECTRRHASFDPAFGTYTDTRGHVRFCSVD